MKVLTPTTVLEAAAMLRDADGEATLIAGATDVFVHWPNRVSEPSEVFVDLSGVGEMRAHRWTGDALVLGGLTTYWDIIRDRRAGEEFPILVSAARTVGSIQIQTRGTWAGNIANASPAADGVAAMMALGAVIEFTSCDGTEEVPLDEFYLGYKQLRMRPDQIIRAIRVPRFCLVDQRAATVRERGLGQRSSEPLPNGRGSSDSICQTSPGGRCGFQSFVKVGSRRAQAITKVGVAIAESPAGWRVVANSMAPTVRRCSGVENALENQIKLRGSGDFVDLLKQDLSPIDDIRSTSAYRLNVLGRVLYHELEPVCPWIGPSA